MKGGKPGLNVRRKGALARLEAMKKKEIREIEHFKSKKKEEETVA